MSSTTSGRLLLRTLIREEIEQLGKYAFADERDVRHDPKPPQEEDTPIERHAYEDLVRHVKNNIGASGVTADILRRALQDGSYSDVIRPPAGAYAYRGMMVSHDFLREMGVENPGAASGDQEVDYLYTPRKPVTSWSPRFEVAKKFVTTTAINNPTPGSMVSAVLIASTSDNEDVFLAGDNGLYKLDHINHYATEHEYFSVGPVIVSRVVWADRELGGNPWLMGI